MWSEREKQDDEEEIGRNKEEGGREGRRKGKIKEVEKKGRQIKSEIGAKREKEGERDLDGWDERGQTTLNLCGCHSARRIDAGNDCRIQVEESRLQVKHLHCQLEPCRYIFIQWVEEGEVKGVCVCVCVCVCA